jgi:hypothetical protein
MLELAACGGAGAGSPVHPGRVVQRARSRPAWCTSWCLARSRAGLRVGTRISAAMGELVAAGPARSNIEVLIGKRL